MKKLATFLVAGAIVFTAPSTASAQLVSVTARGGFFAPVGDYEEAETSGNELLRDREGTFTFGGSVNLGLPFAPFGVRVGADYVTGSTLSQEGIGTGSPNEGDAETLYVAGDLIFTPIPRLLVLQPYLAAGAGYRHTSFDVENIPDVTEGDLVGHLGLGVDLGVGGVGVVVEISDYIAKGEDRGPSIEHDLFLTAGVKIPIF